MFDDPSFAVLAHGSERRATTEERAGQVDAKRFFPRLRRCLREWHRPQYARSADEGREASHPLGDREQALHVVDVADVRRRRRRLATAVADACGDVVEGLAVPGGEHDVSAGRRHGLGGGGPDPAAGPRDHRQPSSEPMPRLNHGSRSRHQRRQLGGIAVREPRDSAPDPGGVRHARGIPRATISSSS